VKVVTQEKKRKEELQKLNCQDKAVALKQQQKDMRRRQLDADPTLSARDIFNVRDVS